MSIITKNTQALMMMIVMGGYIEDRYVEFEALVSNLAWTIFWMGKVIWYNVNSFMVGQF